MKILHVINSLGSGGAEKLVVDMCNYSAKESHKVGLFSFVSENDFFEHRLDAEVNYYKNANRKYFDIKKIYALYNVIKKYEVIHVHLFPPFYIIGLLSIFFKNKAFVYTEHSTNNRRRNRIFFLIEKIMYHRYQMITCI